LIYSIKNEYDQYPPDESRMNHTKISNTNKTQMSGKFQKSLAMIFAAFLFIPVTLQLENTFSFIHSQLETHPNNSSLPWFCILLGKEN